MVSIAYIFEKCKRKMGYLCILPRRFAKILEVFSHHLPSVSKSTRPTFRKRVLCICHTASVFERLHRCRDPAAARDEFFTRPVEMEIHDRSAAEESAKFQLLPRFLADRRDHAHRRRLELTMPIAASSAMIAEMVEAGVSPGRMIISSPTEQTAVIASSFSMDRS